MTTHELARMLFACPDKEVVIEGWCEVDKTVIVPTQYDEDTFIIMQDYSRDSHDLVAVSQLSEESLKWANYQGETHWMNPQ